MLLRKIIDYELLYRCIFVQLATAQIKAWTLLRTCIVFCI